MDDSTELAQLRELIELFPSRISIEDVEEANRLARTRFDVIDNEFIPHLAILLKTGKITFEIDNYLQLCQTFHSIIFNDIISINGEFRSRDHQGGGSVYFGGQKRQELKYRFSGSNPDSIESDLRVAFEHLTDMNSSSPVDDALRFYQKFVFTHPFYDGNGRIARLFVNLYLLIYNKFIDWKNLQSKSDFLNKLNYFHETGIEEHFQWWQKSATNSYMLFLMKMKNKAQI